MCGGGTTSTQTVQIPPEVLENYRKVFARSEQVANQPFVPYSTDPNAFVAGMTPTQQAGIENINASIGMGRPSIYAGQESIASGMAQANPLVYGALGTGEAGLGAAMNLYGGAVPMIGQAYGTGQQYAANALPMLYSGASAVNPAALTQETIAQYQSPYNQAVADATYRNLRQQQEEERQKEIGNAIRSGAFGGDRAGIARANLARQQEMATGQTMANIYQQGYGQALSTAQQQQQQALAAAQANRAAQAQAAQQLAGLGQQQYAQGLGAAQAYGGFGQNLSALAQQQAALQQQAAQNLYQMGLGGGQAYAGLGTQAEQQALAGAQAQMAAGQQQQQTDQAAKTALYNQFMQQQGFPYQQAQFLGNIAMGTGALSGSTTSTQSSGGGFFSDRRLKEDAEKIGSTKDGIPIYRFKYKGDDRTQIGLMADEVEKKHPEAVGLSGGYKTVDYKKATETAAKRISRYSGGLVPSSMGGAVDPSTAYEGFARGGYAGGGDIESIYRTALGRAGTPEEYDYWNSLGMSYDDMYNAIAGSPEGQISGFYQKYLGRAGTPEEYQYWIDSGASMGDVANAIANSEEGKKYAGSSEPTTTDTSTSTPSTSGPQVKQLAGGFEQRFDEDGNMYYYNPDNDRRIGMYEYFNQLNGSDSDTIPNNDKIIEAMYRGELGRAGSPEEYAYWVGQLESGKSLSEIQNAISNSAEGSKYDQKTGYVSGLNPSDLTPRDPDLQPRTSTGTGSGSTTGSTTSGSTTGGTTSGSATGSTTSGSTTSGSTSGSTTGMPPIQKPLTYNPAAFANMGSPVMNRYGAYAGPVGSGASSFSPQASRGLMGGYGPQMGYSPYGMGLGGFGGYGGYSPMMAYGGYSPMMGYGGFGGFGGFGGYASPAMTSFAYANPYGMMGGLGGYGGFNPMMSGYGGYQPLGGYGNFGGYGAYGGGLMPTQKKPEETTAPKTSTDQSQTPAATTGSATFNRGGRTGYAKGSLVDSITMGDIQSSQVSPYAPFMQSIPGQMPPGTQTYIPAKFLPVPRKILTSDFRPEKPVSPYENAKRFAELGSMLDRATDEKGLPRRAFNAIKAELKGSGETPPPASPPPADVPSNSSAGQKRADIPNNNTNVALNQDEYPFFNDSIPAARGGLIPHKNFGGSLPYGSVTPNQGYIPDSVLQEADIKKLPTNDAELRAAAKAATSQGSGLSQLAQGVSAADKLGKLGAKGLDKLSSLAAPGGEAAAATGMGTAATEAAAAGLGAGEAAAGLGAGAAAAGEAAAGLGTLGTIGSTIVEALPFLALLGASDRRLKENIQHIGKTNDGQKIYRYNYKGDPRTQIGLMAQEVEKEHPDAVGRAGKYKTVDYRRATEDAVRKHRYHGGLVPGRHGYATEGEVIPASEADLPVEGGLAMARSVMPRDLEREMATEIIRRVAEEEKVPFNIAYTIADRESRLNPNARSKTSGAAGLFQTIPSTFAAMGGRGDITDPEQNARAGIRYIAQNLKALGSEGEDATAGKAYLGHFLGTGGAKSVLRNPDLPISQTLSNYTAAVKSNPFIANWTGADALRWADAKMAGSNEGGLAPRKLMAMRSQSDADRVAAGEEFVKPGLKPEKPFIAAPATREGKEQTWGDFLTSRQFIIPALTAIGAMGTTPTRNLGTALSSGLLAGTKAFDEQSRAQEELAISQKQAETGRMRAESEDVQRRMQRLTQLQQIAAGLARSQQQVPPAIVKEIEDLTKSLSLSGGTRISQAGKAAAEGATSAPATVPASEQKTAETAPAAAPADQKAPEKVEGAAAVADAATKPLPAPQAKVEDPTFLSKLDPKLNPVLIRKAGDQAEVYQPGAAEKAYAEAARIEKDMMDRGYGLGPNREQIEVPGWAEYKESIENMPNVRKFFNEQGTGQYARIEARAQLEGIAKALEILQSNKFAEQKAQFQAALKSAGIPVEATEGMNDTQAEIATKNAMRSVFSRLAEIGGQPRVIEIQGLIQSGANVGLQPEANRKILAESIAALDRADKFLADAIEERKRLGYRFNEPEFVAKWVKDKDNATSKFLDTAYNELALRGAIPMKDGLPDESKLKVGAVYMLEPGMVVDSKGNANTEPVKRRWMGEKGFGRP